MLCLIYSDKNLYSKLTFVWGLNCFFRNDFIILCYKYLNAFLARFSQKKKLEKFCKG